MDDYSYPRVLIVDGCSADRCILEYYLCEEFEVWATESIDQTLTLVENEEFDCYLISTFLSDGPGQELVRALQHRFASVPVILMSDDDHKINLQRIPPVGVTACLPKDLVTQQELLYNIRQLMVRVVEEEHV